MAAAADVFETRIEGKSDVDALVLSPGGLLAAAPLYSVVLKRASAMDAPLNGSSVPVKVVLGVALSTASPNGRSSSCDAS